MFPGVVEAAATDVEPDALHPESGGDWVTAYVELPPEYDPAQVVLETVRLNGTVPAVVHRSRLGDWNHNKIRDWMFKFNRDDVVAALPEGDPVQVTVSGEIEGTARFEGSDAIRVFVPHGGGSSRDEITDAGVAVGGVPSAVRLYPSSPNPFHGSTRIRFDLPADGPVTLRVFDVRGRVIRTLVDAAYPAGQHEAAWDGRDRGRTPLAPGVYFLRLEAGKQIRTVRIVTHGG